MNLKALPATKGATRAYWGPAGWSSEQVVYVTMGSMIKLEEHLVHSLWHGLKKVPPSVHMHVWAWAWK